MRATKFVSTLGRISEEARLFLSYDADAFFTGT